jgi:hypothetical protein
MTALTWDVPGAKLFETGVDRGVLYKRNAQGVYNTGFAWVGLTAVTESPSGAESSKTYADNKVYANITSAEAFDATLEAFTYPDAFMTCDGTAELTPGVFIGQQNRETFGLAYRSKVGNDISGLDFGYKIHLIYGGMAAPSERAYSTINESSDPMPLSWAISTTPVDVVGKKPTALLMIDSTKVSAAKLADLENILYGSAGVEPRLPLPAEVASIIGTTLIVTAQPSVPTYSSATKQITIPTVTGVEYFIDGVKKTGLVTITKDTVVTANAAAGYKLPAVTDDDWLITYS